MVRVLPIFYSNFLSLVSVILPCIVALAKCPRLCVLACLSAVRLTAMDEARATWVVVTALRRGAETLASTLAARTNSATEEEHVEPTLKNVNASLLDTRANGVPKVLLLCCDIR